MTLVLRGAAGTSKSTLTRELVAMAAAQGFRGCLDPPRPAEPPAYSGSGPAATFYRPFWPIYNLREVVEQADESEQPVFQF